MWFTVATKTSAYAVSASDKELNSPFQSLPWLTLLPQGISSHSQIPQPPLTKLTCTLFPWIWYYQCLILSIFQADFVSKFRFVWNYTKLLQSAAPFSLFLPAKRHLGIKTNCPALDSRSPTFCVRHQLKLFQCGDEVEDFLLKATI